LVKQKNKQTQKGIFTDLVKDGPWSLNWKNVCARLKKRKKKKEQKSIALSVCCERRLENYVKAASSAACSNRWASNEEPHLRPWAA